MPRLRSATLVIGILALTAGAPGQKSYQEGLKAAMAKAGLGLATKVSPRRWARSLVLSVEELLVSLLAL